MARLDRLRSGERVAAVSAILLFAFMFFDWYGSKLPGVRGFSGTVPGAGNAWHALDLISILLLGVVLTTLSMAVVRLAGSTAAPTVPMSVVVASLGSIAFGLILFRALNPPDLGSYGGIPVDATLEAGIFLSLIAAAGIAYGGYSTMREEDITFGDAADRLSGQSSSPAPPPPES